MINPGKPLTIYDIAQVIGKAYPKAFSNQNITKGFEVSGIWPVNENVFGDDEFLSSYVSDRPFNAELLMEAGPSTSIIEIEPTPAVTTNNSSMVSPIDIRPFPKAGPRKQSGRGRRKLGKSRILTDTPEKEEIEASVAPKKVTVAKKIKKKVLNDSSSSSDNQNIFPSQRNTAKRTAKEKAKAFIAVVVGEPDGDFEGDSDSSTSSLFKGARKNI